ncbi:cyclic pyranopterin monophosphate synthase [archaeon BMS3Abin16]|nr:cyclic pyranopterin monophosphate synthase [archaeon BMS3Abin16]
MIRDSYGRPLKSLRISVTSKCNFDCVYCHQEGIEKSRSEMTAEEMERIVRLTAAHGVKKVKITGGEPLLRHDIEEIVERIAGVEGITEVSMTTNAALLTKKAEGLRAAGLRRVNISLDTLDPKTFKEITQGGRLETVIEGVKSAVEYGLEPVKLNMVVMRGLNTDKIKEMIAFASENRAILQLIGLMENEYSDEFFKEYSCDLDRIVSELEEEANEVLIRKFMQNRTRYILDEGEVEVVFPMHNTEFCSNCTRIRVTANGKFKPCLMRTDNYVDFLEVMRSGASDVALEKLFFEAMTRREPYFKKKVDVSDAETADVKNEGSA